MSLQLDPKVEALLEIIRKAGKPPFEQLSPEQARLAYAAGWDFLQGFAQEVAQVQDLTIVGPTGSNLKLRVYRGAGTRADEALPCLLFLHGGGWVIGNLDSHDRLCRKLANQARICVVAVDYRLAPEHRFPAGLDDCLAALKWIASADNGLVILRNRIAIGGDSAGGNLAAVVALMGRNGDAPAVMYQALIYPVTDLTCSSRSYKRITSGVPLTAATMDWFIKHYLPENADLKDWRLSPLHASSLSGAPPALVTTVGGDPLCDEGRAYAQRLEDEGVRVASLHMSDQLHGAAMQGRQVPAGELMLNWVAAQLAYEMHHGVALS
jgi:acetyl esterase